MHVELIETVDALRALEPMWEALWSTDPAADIFTSFDWFVTWWEHFGHGRGPAALVVHEGDELVGIPGRGAHLHVLVVHENGEPIAIAPLIVVQGRWRWCPVRILAPPLNSHAPRGGLVVSPAPAAALEILAEYLAKSTAWDVIFLDGIPRRSGLVPTFRQEAARRRLLGSSNTLWSHAYLTLDRTWEDYLERRGRHFRKNLRRAERTLGEVATVTVEQNDEPRMVDAAMRAFSEIDTASWKAADGESVALHPALSAYYSDLARRFARRNRCEVWILKMNGEPAAAFLCLRDNRGVLYTVKTSYKEKFSSAKYSPGSVLMARIVQEAWKRELTGIDFVGRMPFVDRWASGSREFDRLILFGNRIYPSLLRLLDWTKTRLSRIRR